MVENIYFVYVLMAMALACHEPPNETGQNTENCEEAESTLSNNISHIMHQSCSSLAAYCGIAETLAILDLSITRTYIMSV